MEIISGRKRGSDRSWGNILGRGLFQIIIYKIQEDRGEKRAVQIDVNNGNMTSPSKCVACSSPVISPSPGAPTTDPQPNLSCLRDFIAPALFLHFADFLISRPEKRNVGSVFHMFWFSPFYNVNFKSKTFETRSDIKGGSAK